MSELLQRIQLALSDSRDMQRRIGEFAILQVRRGFDNEEAPDGTPWPDNTPATAKKKRGPGILRETDELYNSFKYELRGRRTIVGPTPHPARRILQKGGMSGPNRSVYIAPRPYIGGTQDQASNMGLIVMAHIRGLGDTR